MKMIPGLVKIAPLVSSYELPQSSFPQNGKRSQRYRIFSLAYSELTPQGTILLEREPVSEEQCRLKIQVNRPAVSGFRHWTQAELLCRNDALSSPLSWTVSTKVAPHELAPAYLQSGMSKSATLEDGYIRYQCGPHHFREPVDRPVTCKYNLLDAVQRLPFEKTQRLEFLCLDEFDQVGGLQRLQYRQTETVGLGNGPERLHSYQQTGFGQVPALYWTDSNGRLLFVVSGIEVLVLEEENGRHIVSRKDADVFRDAVKLRRSEGSAA